MSRTEETVDLELAILAESPKAIKVGPDTWLPRSLIQLDDRGRKTERGSRVVIITAPTWLVEREGLDALVIE